MRLHSIKLSGFKSFADTTSLGFPAQVAGVVGPNGSGKSNIVDAIRWVLGERSARELRGGQISDVIFNGSNTRQASSVARIDLHFENAYGKLKGDYARFNEVHIARQVDSEGQSTFFINNVRVRRRDIVDCFLGTGLGPRSYAIIQQGTISRLVEAKPDELRHHLEEVAGISLYRERRHETELRLKNTRENLSRLLDTIEEFDKHLRQLKRQAENATRYRSLKTERDQLHNSLIVARWRGLEKRIANLSEQAQKNQQKADALHTQLAQNEAGIAQVQTKGEAVQTRIEQQQQKYYELKQNIALSEQEIRSVEKNHQDLIATVSQAQQQRDRLHTQHDSDSATLAHLTEQTQQLSQQQDQEQTTLQQHNRELAQVEKDYQRLQQEFQKSQHELYEQQKQLELLRYQITDNEQQAHQIAQKVSVLAEPEDGLSNQLETLDANIATEQHNLTQLLNTQKQIESSLASQREQRHNLAQESSEHEQRSKATERDLRHEEGRRESVQTLIDNTTKRGKHQTDPESLGLTPLLPHIDVAEGWESAIDCVFGDVIRSYVMPADGDTKHMCTALTGSGIALTQKQSQTPPPPPQGLVGIQSIVSGPLPGWVSHTWCAESFKDALAHWDTLKGNQIVCKDGTFFAKDWISFGQPPEGETLVSLQQRLSATVKNIEQLTTNAAAQEAKLAELNSATASLNQAIESQEQQLQQTQENIFSVRSRLERATMQKQSLVASESKRKQEHDDYLTQNKERLRIIAKLKQQLSNQLEKQEQLQQSHSEIHDRHTFTTEQVQNTRAKVKTHNEALQKTQLELNNARTRRDYITKNIEATEHNLASLTQRIATDQQRIHDLEAQPQTLRQALNAQVAELGQYDQQLTELRQEHSNYKHQSDQLALGLRATRSQVDQHRELLQQTQVQTTEARTRQQALLEQLTDSDFETAASTTDEDLNLGQTQEKLDKIERAIRNLGEVNHAAIKDFETSNERRTTLETQHQEIRKATKTLEAAIAKIDHETKTLFKETFDKTNEQLKRIFPDMLGGGSAWLELTNNDLLESGVQIIARPPGKKNATIAMLSGGEKAMTAISLVLSLFSLNPAPFCVLDEVDAPLDDHNIVRFATTIQKIANQVQFVVITHSKITMEYMDTLLGVTMNEPGVSRIVSVNIDSALKLVN